jgi:hypothetical protein
MRDLLHLLFILSICDTLNEVNGIGDFLLCLSIVVQHNKRSLSPLRLDDVPRFLNRIQLATLWGQEHLLKLIIEDFPHHFRLVH